MYRCVVEIFFFLNILAYIYSRVSKWRKSSHTHTLYYNSIYTMRTRIKHVTLRTRFGGAFVLTPSRASTRRSEDFRFSQRVHINAPCSWAFLRIFLYTYRLFMYRHVCICVSSGRKFIVCCIIFFLFFFFLMLWPFRPRTLRAHVFVRCTTRVLRSL